MTASIRNAVCWNVSMEHGGVNEVILDGATTVSTIALLASGLIG